MKAAHLVLGTFLSLLALAATADEERVADYEVEVVVFRHTRPLVASEQWPAQMLAPAITGAVDFSDPEVRLPEGMRRVEPTRLNGEVETLKKLGAYEVLVHLAWRQPGYEEGDARAVRLVAGRLGRPMPERRPARWGLTDPTPPLPGAHDPDSARLPGENPTLGAPRTAGSIADIAGEAPGAGAPALITHMLDGTFTLVRSRFLHVYTDLVYTVARDQLPQAIEQRQLQNPAFSVDTFYATERPPPPPLQSFPMRLHRRMRSQELHYIDHPMVGVIVYTTRLEKDAGQLLE